MTTLLQSGTILINTYKILHVIDQGGMGAIYKAESRLLEGEVYAVKEMLDNFSSPQDKQEGVRLFQQEANILKKLRHPNLPRVHAFFEENNRHYLAMDFIKGRTLESIVESTSDFLPESVVLRWGNALCSILEYLHGQQPPIIFRDLNPRNIMLEDSTGEIKLIDFGIARFFKAGQSSDTLSLGSPGYCPIEQYGRGQTDVRSDVYTLGATLYHLLTKKVPVAAIERIKPTPVLLTPPRKINRRISPKMEQVILRAMEINPDQRFPSVSEMRQALFAQETTRITAQPTQKTVPQTGTQRAPQPQPKPATSAPSQPPRKTTGPAPPPKSRFSRRAWTVVLIAVGILLAQWVEDWQERASGNDGTPDGATALTVPGIANGRVSFYEGDRIDWWMMNIAQPDTLRVTVTPQYKTDGMRLTLFDQSGNRELRSGVKQATHLEAVLVVDRPRIVLAQVMAPKLWDAAPYTIRASVDEAESTLYASLANVEMPLQGMPGGQNHPTPEGAPVLRLNTIAHGLLQVHNGQGVTWWRLSAPETGLLTLTVAPRGALPPPAVEFCDNRQRPLPVTRSRLGGLTVPVLEDEDYLVKLFAQGHTAPAPYELTVTLHEDPEAFSGPDRAPVGASLLSLERAVRDTVSYRYGDQTDWWKLPFSASGRIGVDLNTRRNEEIRMRLYDAAALRGAPSPDPSAALGETAGSGHLDVDGKAGAVYYLAVIADRKTDRAVYDLEARFLMNPDANSGPDADPEGAKALPVNGGSRGSVDYGRGDRTDWWRITPPGPGVLTVTLIGRETSASVALELYDRSGEDLLSKGRSAGSGREELTIDLPGQDTYLVKVFAETEEDAAEYQLLTWYSMGTAARSGGDGSPEEAAELSLGRTEKGTVDYNAGNRTDWWKVRVSGPGTLTVELEGESFMTNLDMALYDESDQQTPLATSYNRNSSRERVSVEVDRKGWYYIEIFAQKTGDKSRYSLTASFER